MLPASPNEQGDTAIESRARAVPPTVARRRRPPGAWRHTPWYLLFVLTAVNTINWADRQVVPILFPGIRNDLELSDSQLGMIGGLAFSLIYAVSSFAFGHAADRHIRRNLIAFGLVLWSAATAAGALATGFGTLFAARFFTGVGEASLYPSAMSLIAERFPAASRGRAMGIFGTAAALGGGVGVALGGYLAERMGWRDVFWIYGLAGLCLLPLILGLPEQRRRAERTSAEAIGRVIRELVSDGRLLALWLSGMVMIAAGIGYSAWIPSYFVRERGFDVAAAGYVFGAAMVVGGVAGSLLGGFLSDRGRRRRLAGQLDVSALVAFLAAPLAVGTIVIEWAPAFIALAILTPVMIFAFFPSLQTVIVEIVPAHRHGLAYAINILFLGGIGSATGPFLVGAVSDATGELEVALLLTAGGMLASAFMIAGTGTLVRRRRTSDGRPQG